MNHTTAEAPNEPPGFREAWERIYRASPRKFSGSRAAYAQFFAAGAAEAQERCEKHYEAQLDDMQGRIRGA